VRFNVVFSVSPETAEYEREWKFIACNIPNKLREPKAHGARGYEAWEAGGGYAWEAFGGDLPGDLWEEGDVPADVAAGGKFVALVDGRTYRSGNPLDGYEVDAYVEVKSYRKIGDAA